MGWQAWWGSPGSACRDASATPAQDTARRQPVVERPEENGVAGNGVKKKVESQEENGVRSRFRTATMPERAASVRNRALTPFSCLRRARKLDSRKLESDPNLHVTPICMTPNPRVSPQRIPTNRPGVAGGCTGRLEVFAHAASPRAQTTVVTPAPWCAVASSARDCKHPGAATRRAGPGRGMAPAGCRPNATGLAPTQSSTDRNGPTEDHDLHLLLPGIGCAKCMLGKFRQFFW